MGERTKTHAARAASARECGAIDGVPSSAQRTSQQWLNQQKCTALRIDTGVKSVINNRYLVYR